MIPMSAISLIYNIEIAILFNELVKVRVVISE